MVGYQGGKGQLGKKLSIVISNMENNLGLSHLPYVEPFCGMCGVMKNMYNINPHRKMYAYDINPDIIEMWKSAQNGWIPPTECDENQFKNLKTNRHIPSAERGFLGSVACYGNIFMSYYRKPVDGQKDYIGIGYRSLMKMYPVIKDCNFSNSSYENVDVTNKVVYCDPPYAGNKFKTEFFQTFDHDKFWEIMRIWSENSLVFISEAVSPPDFVSIWSKDISVSVNRQNRTSVNENLFVHESWYDKLNITIE